MAVFKHWSLMITVTMVIRARAYYEYYDTGYVSDLNGDMSMMDWSVLGGQTHQPKCVDIPSSMALCRDIGYKTMRLPNLLDHETLDEAVDQTRIWVPLLNLHCHPDTKLFLCSLYSPVCLEPAVYPCKSLCEGVKRGCEERIVNYGYPWPEILDCEQFPEQLCIEQVNFENTDTHGFEYDYTNGDYLRDHDPAAWNSMDIRPFLQRQCVPIPSGMDLCENVGYANMSLPNMLGHDTVEEIKAQAKHWVMLRNVGCHSNTELFLCSLYAPVCLERPIYPCQGLCESVKESCAPYLNKYGFDWPEILNCTKFPSDDGLCIKELNMTNNTAVNVCHACKQPLTFESLLDSYCWANFVAKVKIRKVIHDKLGDKKLVTKGKIKFYKPKPNTMTKGEIRAMEMTIMDGASCDCEAVTNPSKNTLVMGSKQGDRFVITYVSDWTKQKEFKRALRSMRKGHDCKKQIDDIAGQTDINNGGLSISGKPGKGDVVDTSIGGDVTGVDGDGGKKNKNKSKGKKKKNKKDRDNKTKGRKNKKNKDKGKNDDEGDEEPVDPLANLAGFACVQCKQPIVYDHLIDMYCSANFVLKFKVAKIKIDENGDKKLISKKIDSKDFYRQEGLSKRDLRKLQPVLDGSNSCDCTSAAKGKSLFIMGLKQGGRDVITFLSDNLRDGEFKRFTRAVRKGYDCSTVTPTN